MDLAENRFGKTWKHFPELLLVDDDTMLVNDELLKGLDKELDDFLKELLEK